MNFGAMVVSHDPMPLTYVSLQDIGQRRAQRQPLFALGRVVATPAALDALGSAGMSPLTLLRRHQFGDWCDSGELCGEDQATNDQALLVGARVLSVYRAGEVRLYVITEAVNDAHGRRDSTCILLPEEY